MTNVATVACRLGLHPRGGWIFDDDDGRFIYVCINCGKDLGKVGKHD